MLFGRVAKDTFVLDFTYPLCAVQAFSSDFTGFGDADVRELERRLSVIYAPPGEEILRKGQEGTFWALMLEGHVKVHDDHSHAQLGAGLFSLLAAAVCSEAPHVAAVAAATVWLLSECDETRARLPMAELVPALLALATRPRDGPQDESAAQIRERRRRAQPSPYP